MNKVGCERAIPFMIIYSTDENQSSNDRHDCIGGIKDGFNPAYNIDMIDVLQCLRLPAISADAEQKLSGLYPCFAFLDIMMTLYTMRICEMTGK